MALVQRLPLSAAGGKARPIRTHTALGGGGMEGKREGGARTQADEEDLEEKEKEGTKEKGTEERRG